MKICFVYISSLWDIHKLRKSLSVWMFPKYSHDRGWICLSICVNMLNSPGFLLSEIEGKHWCQEAVRTKRVLVRIDTDMCTKIYLFLRKGEALKRNISHRLVLGDEVVVSQEHVTYQISLQHQFSHLLENHSSIPYSASFNLKPQSEE